MKAGSRLGRAAVTAAAIACAPTVVGAQETPAPTTNTPSDETIGPRELQNFSLEGTRTTPAATNATPAPGSAVRPTPAPAQRSAPAAQPEARTQVEGPSIAPERPANEPRSAARSEPDATPLSSTDVPSFDSSMTAVPAPADPPRQFNQPASPAAQPNEAWPLLPWLAVLLAALGAGALFLWRRRSNLQFASGGYFEEERSAPPQPETPPARRVVQPMPVPAAAPLPLAREPSAKASSGLVSARLRPSIEIGFEPVQCILDDELLTIQFRIDLFNSGNAPARAVLAEANVFNAGSEQDQQIGTFFTNPVGQGERIDAIGPLKRIVLTSQIAAPRDQLQQFEVAGRKLAVPVIAFNALYSWAGGTGQTSAAYLLGRRGTAEKMAPFRLDAGSRTFTDLEARLLPINLKR